MKDVSDTRKQEIATFSAVVRKVGAKLGPQSKDAERIRLVASALDAGEPAVKKWWYGQNAPRGGAARALLRQLEQIISPDDDDVVFDGDAILN